MYKAAKEGLGADGIDVVADMGYYDGDEVKACLEQCMTPYITRAKASANSRRGLFTRQDFAYDPENDCYLCPADQALRYRFTTLEERREIRYYANPAAYRSCPLKAKCTRNKRGRRITRWVDEHILEAKEARVCAQPDKLRPGKLLAECPFGTTEHAINQGDFLIRGLEKVRAGPNVMAHNIKRAISILGVPRMIQALA